MPEVPQEVTVDLYSQVGTAFIEGGPIAICFGVCLWYILRQSKNSDEANRELQKQHNESIIKEVREGFKQLNSTFKDHSDGDEKQMQKIREVYKEIKQEFGRISNTKLTEEQATRMVEVEMSYVSEKKLDFLDKRLELNHIKDRPDEFRQDVYNGLVSLSGEYLSNFRKIKTDVGNLAEWYSQRGFTVKNFELFFEKVMQILSSEDTKENKLQLVRQLMYTTRNGIIHQLRQDYISGVLVTNLPDKI